MLLYVHVCSYTHPFGLLPFSKLCIVPSACRSIHNWVTIQQLTSSLDQSVVTVEGICRVPSNYLPPVVSDITQLTHGGRVYIHADTFGICSGCVTALSVCYTAVLSYYNSMTVVILDNQNTIVHVYDFNGPAYSYGQNTDCRDFGVFSTCCTHRELTPSEQFAVQSNHRYGIWSDDALASHPTLMVPGDYVSYYSTTLEVGVNIETTVDTIPKIYLHFVISPGNHSRSVFTTAPYFQVHS